MFFCRLLIFFSQTAFFRKIILVLYQLCQIWIQIRPNVLSNIFWVQTFCKGYHVCTDLQHLLQLLFVVRVLATHPPNYVIKPYSFSISNLRSYKLEESHAQNMASCQEPIFQHNHSKLIVCRLTSVHCSYEFISITSFP